MKEIRIGDLVVIDVGANIVDVDLIRAKTPVKTGRLREGFRLDDGDIVNEVEYVNVVEYGTATRPGVYMIARSIPEIADRIMKRVNDQLRGKKLLPDETIHVRAF